MTMTRLRPALIFCSVFLALLCGCGDDGVPGAGTCSNCEFWTQLTEGGALYPAAHPSRAGVFAFSSPRASSGSEGENLDIWVSEPVGADSVALHRITDDPGDELLPAWSPDGQRLSFARYDGARRDIWIVNVSALESPTDLQKATSSGTVSAFPGRSSWRDDNSLIFTNGDDIYELTLSTGSLVELVPDPSDAILGLGLRFTENQPSFGLDAETGQALLAFISIGRGPQGNIQVDAFAETGETVNADIFIDSKPLLRPATFDTLKTPFLVVGVAPTTYVVSVRSRTGPDRFCDTTLVRENVIVNSNATTRLEYTFTRPRGAIRIVGPRPDGSTQAIAISEFGGFYPTGAILKDTTQINCLWEGNYRVNLLGAGAVIDSVDTFVCGRKISQVCLTQVDGGCPDSLPSVACLDTLDYGAPLGKTAPAVADRAPAPPSLRAPQADNADLWIYNFDLDNFVRVTTDFATDQRFPTISPDGAYVAYIEDTDGVKELKILNVKTLAVSGVPLPGRTSTRICNRSVAHPSWAPNGVEILVSLTNCDDEVETNEISDIWRVDVSRFLP